MTFDLIRRVETLGHPRVLVVGDLILDRYHWGAAERISQEAAVPLLRAEEREHRLGGAAGVALMLRTLGADVQVMGVVGRDPEGVLVRRLLSDQLIDDSLVVALDDRATTLRERFIGRAQGRHPQQMLRVDHEVREALSEAVEAQLLGPVTEAVADAELVLIADHDLGVCTPRLLRTLIAAARSLGARVVADPIRATDYSKYHWLHALIPNRLDAQHATGMTIGRPDDALAVGRRFIEMLDLEAALVTLDREGMALVQSDGRAMLVPARPREVYDSTGASEIVLTVVGLCLASGGDYDEAAALGNVAGGLEVEKFGSVALTRADLIRGLIDRHRPCSTKRLDGLALLEETRRHRDAGGRIVLARGALDPRRLDHVRWLREAAGLGDYLVVGVTAEDDRAELLAALECVDAVTRLDGENPLDLIETLLPDVLVVETDLEPAGREEVEATGGRVVVVPRVEAEEAPATDRTLVVHQAETLPPAPAARPKATARKPRR